MSTRVFERRVSMDFAHEYVVALSDPIKPGRSKPLRARALSAAMAKLLHATD